MNRRAQASRRLYAKGIKFLSGGQTITIVTSVKTRDINGRIASSGLHEYNVHAYLADSNELDSTNGNTVLLDKRLIVNAFDLESMNIAINESDCKVRMSDGDYTILSISRGAFDAFPAAYILTVRK